MPIPLRTPSDHVVDLVDESFVRARPTVLRAVLEDPRLDALVWPGHEVSVTRDRGHKGRHYAVAGRITGVAEVWLEPFDDGTIVHHYVRGTTRALTARSARAAVAAHRLDDRLHRFLAELLGAFRRALGQQLRGPAG